MYGGLIDVQYMSPHSIHRNMKNVGSDGLHFSSAAKCVTGIGNTADFRATKLLEGTVLLNLCAIAISASVFRLSCFLLIFSSFKRRKDLYIYIYIFTLVID